MAIKANDLRQIAKENMINNAKCLEEKILDQILILLQITAKQGRFYIDMDIDITEYVWDMLEIMGHVITDRGNGVKRISFE